MNEGEQHGPIIEEEEMVRIDNLSAPIARTVVAEEFAQIAPSIPTTCQETRSIVEGPSFQPDGNRGDTEFAVSISPDQVAACIAHEVNQPLTGILANASAAMRWLERDAPDIDKARAALTNILIAGQHASDVINGLPKVLASQPPVKAKLNLNELIKTISDLLRPQLSRRRIALDIYLAEDIPPIEANRTQLQQVIFNLLTNAIEAMLSVEHRVLRITTDLNTQSSVRVSIQDTGVGVEPTHLDRIFQPGFTTKPANAGFGLGLCQSVIKAHNGRFWVSGVKGKGSEFQFELPVAPRQYW
jgi:signal transduction histidine kinase